MLVSERVLKWAVNFYPPLLFQRVWVIKFEKDFRGVRVKINKSLLNRNTNSSIFGGTIFSAADPFIPLLFHHILSHKGYKVKAWSRSAAIRFVKPGNSDLYFNIVITDSELADCEHQLNLIGKYRKSYFIEIFDRNEKLCASVIIEMYVRNLSFSESTADGE
jgi:acyl-coenzyme A thioesterase PaaI-like protein